MINEVKEKLITNKKIQIRVYSLDYTIEQLDDNVVIYANLYPNQKKSYRTIEELLDNFTIYNENIIDNIDSIVSI